MQVFDKNGKVQAVWHDVYRPDGICMDADGLIYIGELNSQAGLEDCPRLGHRISVYNQQGQRVARFGDPEDGDGPGQFIAPHGAAVDSQGNLYIGEVSYTMKGARQDPPVVFGSISKLRRLR
jgi:sugar lactone lactonase YvrE